MIRNDGNDPGAQVFTRIRQAAASGGGLRPGEAFYHDEAGENLARFCFAKEDALLEGLINMKPISDNLLKKVDKNYLA